MDPRSLFRYGKLLVREDVCCKEGVFSFMVYKSSEEFYFVSMHNGEVKSCKLLK